MGTVETQGQEPMRLCSSWQTSKKTESSRAVHCLAFSLLLNHHDLGEGKKGQLMKFIFFHKLSSMRLSNRN